MNIKIVQHNNNINYDASWQLNYTILIQTQRIYFTLRLMRTLCKHGFLMRNNLLRDYFVCPDDIGRHWKTIRRIRWLYLGKLFRKFLRAFWNWRSQQICYLSHLQGGLLEHLAVHSSNRLNKIVKPIGLVESLMLGLEKW